MSTCGTGQDPRQRLSLQKMKGGHRVRIQDTVIVGCEWGNNLTSRHKTTRCSGGWRRQDGISRHRGRGRTGSLSFYLQRLQTRSMHVVLAYLYTSNEGPNLFSFVPNMLHSNKLSKLDFQWTYQLINRVLSWLSNLLTSSSADFSPSHWLIRISTILL